MILVAMVALLLLGLPVVFAMGLVAMVYMFAADINMTILAQRMVSRLNSFLILAILLFYLAGELMNACRLTDRIVAMSRAFVGHIHGGLAQVNIFASMIFAGMSGAACGAREWGATRASPADKFLVVSGLIGEEIPLAWPTLNSRGLPTRT